MIRPASGATIQEIFQKVTWRRCTNIWHAAGRDSTFQSRDKNQLLETAAPLITVHKTGRVSRHSAELQGPTAPDRIPC